MTLTIEEQRRRAHLCDECGAPGVVEVPGEWVVYGPDEDEGWMEPYWLCAEHAKDLA